MLPVTQIDTFYNGLTLRHRDTINATAGGTFMKRRPEECYDLIENMTAHHNDWDTLAQQSESSSSITSSIDSEIIALKAEMAEINKNLMKGNNQGRNQFFQGASHGQNPPPAYQAPAYQALGYQAPDHQPSIPQPQVVTTTEFTNYMKEKSSFSLPQVVECETEVTKDTMPPTHNESTKDVQPLVVQVETQIPIYVLIVSPVAELVAAPVSASKPNKKALIPYPSRLHDQKLCDKANDQKEKFFQIFQDLNFNISFADALILMPKFGPTIKSLLTNKDKLFELARTPLNEHCSVVLLKKLPEKLGDPGKFLIPCDFLGTDECLALADLDASINLMPLSVWNKLSLPELTSTLMTLELADRSNSRPIGFAEDVFIKVGKFHFPVEFVVVDFDADPRVPLILGRSFLKTKRALIDVYAGELTLRVNNEAVTFNLDQTLRYSATYNDITANRVDIIDMAYEEYSQEAKNDKSSIDEPPEVELKDLPPHLEYAFLEGDDKLPVIIAKDLSVEEKAALIKVLKSHKQAIAWKLSDIKGINLEFCTHKILIEDDFEPVVQHQRRVNPKIYEACHNGPTEGHHGPNYTTKRCLTLVFIGPQSTVMPTTWSNLVTLVNVKERFRNVMKYLKTPSKFVRFFTFGASISWGGSRFHEGTSIYSWSSITCRNGLKQKRSTNNARVISKFLKSLFARFGTPRVIISDRGGSLRPWFKKNLGKDSGREPCLLDLKHCNYDLLTAGDHRKVQLNELNKLHDQAYENSLIYKEKTKRLHDSKIKYRVFNVGDRVLLFNSRLKNFSRKLKTRWSGPFTITQVFPYGTVKLSQTDGPNFKVNGHRLKHYFGEDIPKMVVLYLQTFPKDQ
nr:reverse transcriptase domain-containing protein [Tanacetum cinerariifolium]